MKIIGKIFKDDVRQFFTSFFIIVIILGITVIPALYAWLNIYSNWDPYGNTAGLSIAFYCADEGCTVGSNYENVGQELRDELMTNDAIHWVFSSSEDEAVKGVRSGSYYAAVIVEKDFTYRILNFFMDDVDKPAIIFYQNQKKNPVATKISDAVINNIHKSLNKKLTGVIVEKVFDTANEVEGQINAAGGIDGVVSDMEDLNGQIRDYRKTIDSVMKGNEVLLSAISEGKIDAAKTGEDIASTRAALSDSSSELTATELTLGFYTDTCRQTLDGAESRLSGMQKTLQEGKISGDVAVMGTAVASAADDMNVLMDDIDTLNKTIGSQYMPDSDKVLPPREDLQKAAASCHEAATGLSDSAASLTTLAKDLRALETDGSIEETYGKAKALLQQTAEVTKQAASTLQTAADAAASFSELVSSIPRSPVPGMTDEQWKEFQQNAATISSELSESAAAMKTLADTAETTYETFRDSEPETEAAMKEDLESAAAMADSAAAILSDASSYAEEAGDALDLIVADYDAIAAAVDKIGPTLSAYYDSLAVIRTELNNMAATTAGDTAVTDTVLLEKTLADQIDAVLKELSSTENTFDNGIRPGVNASLESLSNVLANINDMLASLSKTVYGMGNVFDALSVSLTSAQDSLEKTDDLLGLISDRLTRATEKVAAIEDSDELTILMNTLSGDPASYSDFFSEPVQINDNVIYPVKNYGSAVTPFYTILSIWVGALVLAAILKTKVKTGKYPQASQSQLYFGRYLSFLLIAELQTAVTVIGDLCVFRVQCLHPFLFWFGCAYTALVFSLFIYSLVLAFGDVGKAIAVVMVVIQIAGSSGTYPIELLPDFFQKVYLFFPFPYAINALRETIGGMYDGAYALYLLELSVFIIVSLVVGLLVRRPFRSFNKFMYKRMEDSSLF